MPLDSSIATTAHVSLSNDPASFHCTNIYNIESSWKSLSISTVGIEENAILSIHFDRTLLEEQVHGNLFTIVGRDNHLLTVELISNDLGRSSQFNFLDKLDRFLFMVIFVNGAENERRLEVENQIFRLVVRIKTRRDLTKLVVHSVCLKLFCV